MAAERAIDKLKKAYNVENRSSYAIYKGEDLILKIFWSPITIADRDKINTTLRAMGKGDEEGSLDFALQVIIEKAQDSSGKSLFTLMRNRNLEVKMNKLFVLMSKTSF